MRLVLIAILAAATACAGAARPAALTPAQMAARDGGIPPYTAADVAFMSGMIGHHAQAVEMAELARAAGRGASSPVQTLAGRIHIAQSDEIALMQRWLADRGKPVPQAGDHHAHGDHGLMPGMLTRAQMDSLTAARGTAFDRLFLRYMIQHHEGALVMLEQLFSAPRAGEDDVVFKFASDVHADQSTEIGYMTKLLESLPREP
jgi:uncharacterized protein (DUF305 family)